MTNDRYLYAFNSHKLAFSGGVASFFCSADSMTGGTF